MATEGKINDGGSADRERPINLRPGRVTLIRLPSGEIIRLRAVQEGRGKRLGAQLPVGTEIDHEK